MTTAFIERMKIHWEKQLRLELSSPLITGWEQLEAACLTATKGNAAWQVLQLPTGTGKTQALTVLCASQSLTEHPGILIVTRCTAEADEIALSINQLSAGQVALAVHQKSPASLAKIHASPVLVVTHSAYRNALREIVLDNACQNQWDRIGRYQHGNRSWLIVDEAFEWVEAYQGDVTELSVLNGALSSLSKPELVPSLSGLAELTNSIVRGFETDASAKLLTGRQTELLHSLDIDRLKSLVSSITPADMDIWPSIEKPRHALRKEYLKGLEQLNLLQSVSNAWVSKRGKRIKLNGSRLLMAPAGKRGVILDATAAIDATYELLGNRTDVLPRPANGRIYGNVTLNLSTGHSVGKEHLSKQASLYWPRIRSALNNHLHRESHTLIICHKDVEASLSTKGLNSCDISKAHWGDLDGKNHWREYDVGVIFGMPFLDDVTPTNAVLAYQPHLAETWFDGGRSFGSYLDIGQTFKDGFVAKSVVQALNRIRCRKPTDRIGNCMPTELFMLLGNCRTSAAVTGAIQSQMPGIQVREWDAGMATGRKKRSPTQDKLLSLLTSLAPGIHLKSSIIVSLGINDRTFERMSPTMQQPSSTIAQELTSLGVEYHCATGRGKEAYFMKS